MVLNFAGDTIQNSMGLTSSCLSGLIPASPNHDILQGRCLELTLAQAQCLSFVSFPMCEHPNISSMARVLCQSWAPWDGTGPHPSLLTAK